MTRESEREERSEGVMDCEKFETTMIDELYGELDELTSAAAKRHVSGCARCAAIIGGLRATRRVAVLPLVEPPDDLEERILAAARQAQRVVPLKTRVARAVSRAGSWAMRPQTAMAAVFLVMIGSSAMLLRGRAKAPATSAVTVTDQGAPAAPPAQAIATASDPSRDEESAANAHGAPARPTASAVAAVGSSPTTTLDDVTKLGDLEKKGLARGLGQLGSKPTDDYKDKELSAWGGNAAPPAGAPNTLPQNNQYQQQAPPPAAAAPAATATAAQGAGGYASGPAGAAAFNNAMAVYNAGRYDDAARLFGGLAANDSNAALWEARSMREGSAKCRGAAAKFDLVAQRAAGTTIGYDAKLEGARCYRVIGQSAAAIQRLNELLAVPSHEARARTELQSMNAGQAAKAPAKAAPSPPPAAPAPNTKSDSSYRYRF